MKTKREPGNSVARHWLLPANTVCWEKPLLREASTALLCLADCA